MKEKQADYNNGFIEVASYETSALLLKKFPATEQISFLISNNMTIKKDIEKLNTKITELTKTMTDESGSLSLDRKLNDKANVTATDLNDTFLLQKKEEELTIIRKLIASYANFLRGAINTENYHLQRDELLTNLTTSRAEFYLIKARCKAIKYNDWKSAHPEIDTARITEQGWDIIAPQIYREKYFSEFGISMHKSRRINSIQGDEIQDAKYKIRTIQDDIAKGRPVLPPTNEEKDTIVLSLANRLVVLSKIGALSEMTTPPIEYTSESKHI